MPPRKNKKQKEQDEELDKKESKSKWASVLNYPDSEEEEELAPAKKAFQFDFSKEHRLYKDKPEPKKQEPKVVLSPEEQEKLERQMEKQRQEKEEKERIKKQKRMQKKKILEKEKEQQKLKKAEEEKEQKQLEYIVNSNKGSSDSKKIIFWMVAVLIFLGVLNYQKDIYARLSKFKLDASVDYYSVLQISHSSSDAELRNQYKKLVVKYHPDKNPNCRSCTQKFNSIMQAWQILGNPEKRKSYDQSTGFITQIPSQTLTLTPDNYEWLLGDSDSIWIVQVYDSTNQYCHYFAQFWQEFASKYRNFVKAGRMDVWQQSQMKSYAPYKFQLFPGIYTVHQGSQKLCQFDFDRPLRSLELCVEQLLQETAKVTKISDWSQIPEKTTRLPVILGSSIKMTQHMKLTHSSLSRYLQFYQMKQGQSSQIQVKGKDIKFTNFTTSSAKKVLPFYKQFLEGIVRQQKSECQILYQCKDRSCLLLLDEKYMEETIMPFPLMQVKQKQQFNKKIEYIKNVTGMLQKFDIGLYKDGKIELGYFSQIADLNPQNGEVIDFQCKQRSLVTKILETYKWISSLIQQ